MVSFVGEVDEVLGSLTPAEEVHVEVELSPTTTKKYIVLSVTKLWGSLRFRYTTDDIQDGATYAPPLGRELRVAFVRRGQEERQEDLPEGAIDLETFLQLLKDQLELSISLRKFYIQSIKDIESTF